MLQRIFASGLALQATLKMVPEPAAAERIHEVLRQLDETIRELRGVIFGLERGYHRLGGVRSDVLAVAAEAARALGFQPDVVFDGPIDAIGDALGPQLVAALREMLSNVARHAKATAVRAELSAGSELVIRVIDDGVGLTDGSMPGNGLRNLRARATELGGTFHLRPGATAGTVAEWVVPAPR